MAWRLSYRRGMASWRLSGAQQAWQSRPISYVINCVDKYGARAGNRLTRLIMRRTCPRVIAAGIIDAPSAAPLRAGLALIRAYRAVSALIAEIMPLIMESHAASIANIKSF